MILTSELHFPTDKVPEASVLGAAELGYLAGILDGEGSIGIYNDRGRWVRPKVSVSGAYRPMLERFQKAFGGAVYNDAMPGQKRGTGIARRRTYVWVLSRTEDLKALMPQLLPYLGEKKLQARALVKFLNEPEGSPNRAHYVALMSALKTPAAYEAMILMQEESA